MQNEDWGVRGDSISPCLGGPTWQPWRNPRRRDAGADAQPHAVAAHELPTAPAANCKSYFQYKAATMRAIQPRTVRVKFRQRLWDVKDFLRPESGRDDYGAQFGVLRIDARKFARM